MFHTSTTKWDDRTGLPAPPERVEVDRVFAMAVFAGTDDFPPCAAVYVCHSAEILAAAIERMRAVDQWPLALVPVLNVSEDRYEVNSFVYRDNRKVIRLKAANRRQTAVAIATASSAWAVAKTGPVGDCLLVNIHLTPDEVSCFE